MKGSPVISLLEFGYTTLNTVILSLDFVIGKWFHYGAGTLGLLQH